MTYGVLNYSISRFETEYTKLVTNYRANEFKRKRPKELMKKDTFALADALDTLFEKIVLCTGLVAFSIESFCQSIPQVSLQDENVTLIITNQLPHFQSHMVLHSITLRLRECMIPQLSALLFPTFKKYKFHSQMMLFMCTQPLQIRPIECIQTLSTIGNNTRWFNYIASSPKYVLSDLHCLIGVLWQCEFTISVVEYVLAIEIEIRSRMRKLHWSEFECVMQQAFKLYHTATTQSDQLWILIMEGLVDDLKTHMSGTVVPIFFKYLTMIDSVNFGHEMDRNVFDGLFKVILENFDRIYLRSLDYTRVNIDFTIPEIIALCKLTSKHGMKFVSASIAKDAAEKCEANKMKKELKELNCYLYADGSEKMIYMEIIEAYIHRSPKRKPVDNKSEKLKKIKVVKNDPLSSTIFDSTDSVFI